MIVREVRLENIKSYGTPAETVRLTRGVNAISGQNGAGKSTILEAIGSALFQHLPYRQEVFVREGEGTGTITVVVDSSLDGRTYEVFRRVGKGATQYVYDVDLAQQIARGEADVGRWLRQHLGLDADVDLKSLFLDTVGPPQGTLTAAFLEAATVRRAKFNRLLRVEEYEEAFRKLSALETTIEAERQALNVRIAVLEGQTRGKSDLELRHLATRDEQATLGIRLGRLVAERETLDRLLAGFDEASQRWNAARATLDLATEREQGALTWALRAREAVRVAREAAATCSRTKAARDAYLQVDLDLAEQDRRRSERDRLRGARHDLSLQQTRLQNDFNQLEIEIRRGENAALQIAELEARIPDQVAAEARLLLAREAKREIDDLKKRKTAIEDRGNRARERVARIERALADAAAQRTIADQVEARRDRHVEAASVLATINRAEGEIAALRAAIRAEEDRLASLRTRLNTLERQVRDAAVNGASVIPLVAVESRFREIAEQRASALSRLDHAESTRSQVSDGLCPFLREPCRNLRPGVTLDTYFESETRQWSAEVAKLDVDYSTAERQLGDARTLDQRRAVAEGWRRELASLSPDLATSETRLTDLQRQHVVAAQLVSQKAETGRAEKAALAAVKESERAARELERLPVLEAEAEDARAELMEARADWTATRDRLANAEAIESEFREAEGAAKRIGNPRDGVIHHRADADRVPALLAKRDEVANQCDEIRFRGASIDESLAVFADLDRQIAELTTSRAVLRPQYEQFIAAISLAEDLNPRLVALEEAEKQLAVLSSVTARAREEVDRAAKEYDEGDHETSRQRRGKLDSEIGDVRARIDNASDSLARLDQALAAIEELERELTSLRESADRIDEERNLAMSIRQAVRATGPEITRRLLASISRLATSINADILNQAGIEIEWTTDYDIVTRRQGETRGFAQLSGGEQMAAALAVRMAAMRLLSNIRVAFLDEPTAHLDQSRRANLGDQVQHLQGFDQLVVISHDDTFDGLFGHVVRIAMEDGRSRVSDDG